MKTVKNSYKDEDRLLFCDKITSFSFCWLTNEFWYFIDCYWDLQEDSRSVNSNCRLEEITTTTMIQSWNPCPCLSKLPVNNNFSKVRISPIHFCAVEDFQEIWVCIKCQTLLRSWTVLLRLYILLLHKEIESPAKSDWKVEGQRWS